MNRRLKIITTALACILLPSLAAAQRTKLPGTKSGFVKTGDGVKIHYLEAGQIVDPSVIVMHPNPGLLGPRPAILFVPGWTMPAEIWEHQIAHFSQRTRVVAMDPRSQGKSSQTSDGHYPAARARDIKAVVDQLGLAPVVLVGWSMGVTELAAYVDQFGTDTVAGLVLVDGLAGWDFDPKTTPRFWEWAAGFQKDRSKQTDAFVRSMYKKPQSEDYLQRIIRASLRTPTNSAMALLLGLLTSDYRLALEKINKPALILFASGTQWDALYEDLARRIAGSRVERFPGAGHALFVDEPARFNSLLDEFLRLLAGPSR